MNANAKAWVAALRSGSFNQTKGTLRDGSGYCCLGVASELAEQDGLTHVWRRETLLTDEVQRWLGLNSPDGTCINQTLVVLNDFDNFSFDEIADVIESEPEGLFVKESV